MPLAVLHQRGKNLNAMISIFGLNTLNYLLGKSDLRAAVAQLWANDRRVFDVLQILIACRQRDNKKVINADA